MSGRYEWVGAEADVQLGHGGEKVGQDTIQEGAHALILGDPDGTALVVEGTADDLRRWAATVLDAVRLIE